MPPSRELTREERALLERIQHYHGPQNEERAIVWVEGGEAALLTITDRQGEAVLMANLTNLATWYADGTLDEATLLDWLGIVEPEG